MAYFKSNEPYPEQEYMPEEETEDLDELEILTS